MSPGCEPRKRDDRRPSLRICLRSRSSIVACSMKQMHIGGALFGGTALRRAQLGLHIYLYTRARVRAVLVHAPRHPVAQGIYISKWRWSLAPWWNCAIRRQTARGDANFPRIPACRRSIRWLSNGCWNHFLSWLLVNVFAFKRNVVLFVVLSQKEQSITFW